MSGPFAFGQRKKWKSSLYQTKAVGEIQEEEEKESHDSVAALSYSLILCSDDVEKKRPNPTRTIDSSVINSLTVLSETH